MVAVVELFFRTALLCCGKSIMTSDDAAVTDSVVSIQNPFAQIEVVQAEILNEEQEPDNGEYSPRASSQPEVDLDQVSKPILQVSNSRNITGVILQRCFNSVDFPDCLPCLVQLMFKDHQRVVQEHAVRAIAELSTVQTHQWQIVTYPNCLTGLGRLLSKKYNLRVRKYAALALGNAGAALNVHTFVHGIAERPDALYHLIKALVPVLFQDDQQALQDQACIALTHLSSVRVSMEELGAAPMAIAGLVRMLKKTHNQYGQECAALSLSNLALSVDNTGRIVNCPGALRLLVELLVESGDENAYVLEENLAMTLRNLVRGRENVLVIIDSAHFGKFLNRLTEILFRPEIDYNDVFVIQEMAVKTLMNLFVTKEVIERIDEFPEDLLAGLVYYVLKDQTRFAESSAMALGNLALRLENIQRITDTPGAVQSLFSLLLMFENPRCQREAAFAILNLSYGDENVKIQMAEHQTAIGSLVALLFKNNSLHLSEELANPAQESSLQDCAVDVLCNLACVEKNSIKIANFPGALRGLVVLLLDNSNPVLQEKVAVVLNNLARAKENRVKIAEFPGALEGLWSVLLKGDRPILQETAIICLSSLAMEDKTKIAILEFPNMLTDLMQLLSKGEAPMQGLASVVLGALVQNSWWIQLQVVSFPEADVIALLTKLLNYSGDKNVGHRLAVNASWAIGCLVAASENQRKVVGSPFTTQSLVRLMCETSSSDELKRQIAIALACLVEEEETRVAIADAMEGLASLLEAKDEVTDKESRSLEWYAAKAFTMIDIQRGRNLTVQSSFAFGGRAEAFLRFGMYKEALEDLNEANRLDPDDGTTLSYRSFVKTMMQDCQAALPDANRAVELEPQYLFRWSERGILRRIMGDLEGALEDLSKTIEMDFDKKDQYSLFKHRGYIKYLVGDEDGARADAEWALREGVPEWVSYDRLPSMLGCLPVKFLSYDFK